MQYFVADFSFNVDLIVFLDWKSSKLSQGVLIDLKRINAGKGFIKHTTSSCNIKNILSQRTRSRLTLPHSTTFLLYGLIIARSWLLYKGTACFVISVSDLNLSFITLSRYITIQPALYRMTHFFCMLYNLWLDYLQMVPFCRQIKWYKSRRNELVREAREFLWKKVFLVQPDVNLLIEKHWRHYKKTNRFFSFEDSYGYVVSLVVSWAVRVRLSNLKVIWSVHKPWAEEQCLSLSQLVISRAL